MVTEDYPVVSFPAMNHGKTGRYEVIFVFKPEQDKAASNLTNFINKMLPTIIIRDNEALGD